MPHISIHGVNLYYEQAGEGETALVLVHGNVGSSRWWEPLWDDLAATCTVVRLDLRGCGRSEAPGEGYNVPQYSADVRALLRELGIRKAVVVGHSMGGSIAMNIAITEPELLAGMVLINSAPAEGLVTPDERKPLIESMIRDRNLMKMALAAVVPTAASGDLFEAIVDDAMIAGPTMVSNYTSLGDCDFREQLANTKVPTLIVYGTLDSLISLDMMERTRDAIPGSELVLYEGVGHSPSVEAPQRLLEDLKRFVEQTTAQAK
jgi:3-oxoadipate enol-lactonase